jgi:ABC-2 type transport system ATP-binding protein
MNEHKAVLTLNHLTMNFGSKVVLKGINLSVKQGEIIGYIGSNGAGKSTTIKIILGLVEGYGGEVKLFDQDIHKDLVSLKKRIGYVPEAAEIYDNLSGREYLRFLGGFYDMDGNVVDSKALRLMTVFGIKEAYDQRISSYSKGMKQKLLIISSLIHNPDILFFDEPLNGLDANSVIVFKEILAKLKERGKTIFYSSHIMEVVEKISDRIVLLNEGEVVADGSFNELKNNSMTGSLEQLFNQLTGFNEHKELAEEFISAMEAQ